MSVVKEQLQQRRGARKNGLKEHSGGWIGFVDIVLTQEQKEELGQNYRMPDGRLLDFLVEVLEQGYKLSFSPDELHQCVIATLTGKSPDCVNVGYSLSARGPSLIGSIEAIAFKHLEICKGGRWETASKIPSSQLSLWG